MTEPAVEQAVEAAPATETPVVETPASVAAPAVVEVVEAPQPAASLLETFDAEQKAKEPAPEVKADDKPIEPAKVEPEKVEAKAEEPAKDEPKAEEVKAPEPLPPVEWKYEVPETLKLDDDTKGQLHDALEAARTGDAQKLLDLHAKAAADYTEALAREQWRAWDETRKGWVKEVMADPEIGGSGFQTSMGAIARMRDMLVNDKDRPAFEEFLRVTGAGDHPQFLKLLHNAARFYDEPALPPPNPKPPADIGSGGRGERRSVMYNHPRSKRNGT